MKRDALGALLTVSLFALFSLYPVLVAQAQGGGYVSVTGDTEMIGAGEVSGGGHITWTLTGDKARDLRMKAIMMFDDPGSISCDFIGVQIDQDKECFYPVAAGGNNDGNLSEGEAALYLEFVDRWLTYSFGRTPIYRYYRLDRVDTLYESAVDSTTGFVSTPWDSDRDVVIKFIYNSISPEGRRDFNMAELTSVDALYDVFSINLTHTFEDVDRIFSGSQWKRTTLENYDPTGYYSLWPGNESLGKYEDNSSNETKVNLDLRFASYGSVSFMYRGHVADNDYMDVSISDDNGTSWYPIKYLTVLDNTDEWKSVTFDLHENAVKDFMGKQTILKFNFTSDASGNDEGFFVDDITFDAPCVFDGEVRTSQVDYVVGISSFSSPSVTNGHPHIIRLLGGEIMIYSSAYDSLDQPRDLIAYESFNALENPAILFVIMFVCLWFIISLPNKFFSDYKLALEPKKRFGAKKIQWLHWLGRVMIILLLLFYFFPTMFGVIGLKSYISGPVMIILSIAFLVSISLASKLLYDRQIAEIPISDAAAVKAMEASTEGAPPVVPLPSPEGEETSQPVLCISCLSEVFDPEFIQCECGVYYHPACASKMGKCQACGRKLSLAPKEEVRTPVQCPTCSEITIVDKGTDLSKQECPACHSILKTYETGYNYLVLAATPERAFTMLNSFMKRKLPGLCLSTTPKEKLQKKYGVAEMETYWITTMSTGDYIVDPKRLDFEMMRAIGNFMKERSGGVILLDGIENLISENGLDAVTSFLKKVNDMASVNNMTMIVTLNPSVMEKEKLGSLMREFDRIEDFTEKPEGEPKDQDEDVPRL